MYATPDFLPKFSEKKIFIFINQVYIVDFQLFKIFILLYNILANCTTFAVYYFTNTVTQKKNTISKLANEF